MSILREFFFWSGVGIVVGTIIVLIIWPQFFGPLAIATFFASSAMIVLTRPWERINKADKDGQG
jgi:hypothetical protein